MSHHCTIAIIGGSFAGLSALLKLRKRLWETITIKLFDIRDRFTHIPALHEAILDTGYLQKIQFSLAAYYPREFIHEKVVAIKPGELTTASGTIRTFDYAVIATGSRTNFFNNEQFRENAYTVAYPEDIPELNAALPNAKTITVVGGWYTGIEIASIIAERKKPHQKLRVIHARDRLFNRLSQHISDIAIHRLHRHDVEVILNTKVEAIYDTALTLPGGQELPSDVTIAARWIQANDEAHSPRLTFDGEYQSLESDRIYMCGDVATHGLLTTAHNAMIEGRRIGDLIADQIQKHTQSYPAVTNRDKLAIALWSYDGIFTNGQKGVYVPKVLGIAKRVITKRVLFEFTKKVMIPV